MWISVKDRIIEKKPFHLESGECPSGKVTLNLIRRDVWVAFFFLPKRIVEVHCDETDRRIRKTHWSQELKVEANSMKQGLRVPIWGYGLLGILLVTLFIGVPVGFMMEMKATETYQSSFIGMDQEQKIELLKTLNAGDLIATSDKVYRIQKITKTEVMLQPATLSVKARDPYGPMDANSYPESNFSGDLLTIDRSVLEQGRVNNMLIINVLDN